MLKEITIGESSVTLQNKMIPTIDPHSSDLLLTGIIEIDRKSGLEKEKYDQFIKRRTEHAQKTNFVPAIGSFGSSNPEQKAQLENLVLKYRLSFNMDSDDLGRLFGFRYTLPMFDEKQSSHQPPRPIPIHSQAQVEEEISKWKQLDIIEKTQSSFNIPLIILRKSDKTIRISLDARGINSLLVKDRYPLPHFTTVFTRIGERLTNGKECFISSVDFFRGYWQVLINETECHKMAFSYKNEHYQANRMLYGSCNAPAAFSRIMMRLMNHPSIVLYLDDLVIIDSSWEEHLRSLEFIFKTCLDHGLILSAKKCQLASHELDFIGHRITASGIKPLKKHLEAIKNMNPPADKTELKRYLGMVNFNVKFVREGSIILAPLYKMTSQKVDFEWSDIHQEAFDKIKAELLKEPTLAHYKPGSKLVLVTDSSGHAVGGTLYQVVDDEFFPLGYFSKSLQGPDRKRPMRIKELFALCWGIQFFEYFLINTEFDCYVDHKSLLFLFREARRSKLDIKLCNVHNYLQSFNFNIIHKNGASPEMASADFFSRLPKYRSSDLERDCIDFFDVDETIFAAHTLSNDDVIFSFENRSFTSKEMATAQNECQHTRNLIVKSEIKSKQNRLKIKDNVLYSNDRLVLPSKLADEFIQYLHTITAHAGSQQLLQMLRKFFISNIQEKVRAITSSCETCIRLKPLKELRPSLIKDRTFAQLPFEKVFIDLVDYGRPDCAGKRYLLTCVDSLTGYLDGEPLSNKTDNLVSKALLKLILRHGISQNCVSDNGREFGPLTKKILDRFEIRHTTTTAYRSRSNGKCERIHRELHQKLKAQLATNRSWSHFWPLAQYYINNSPKGSLDNLSSNEAVYGRQFHIPFTLKKPVIDNIQPFVKALNEYMKQLHPALLNFQVERYQKLLKRDKNDCPVLDLGTNVLCWKPDLLAGKLGINWSGPYKIHRRLSKDSYIVKCPLTKKEYRRHISLIRPLRRKLQEDTTEFINEEIEKDAEDQISYRKFGTNSNHSTDDNVETSSTKQNKMLTSSQLNQKDRHEPVDKVDNEDTWKNRLRSRRT